MTETYEIRGNTYEHRQELRRAGAEWDAARKVWRLTVRTRGMRRTDGEIYRLEKLPGLIVEREVSS